VSHDSYRIFPLGTDALTIEFGSEISEGLNQKVVNFAEIVQQNPFQGMIEIVPAYSSVTVFYDLSIVKKHFPEFQTAFEAVKYFIEKALSQIISHKLSNSKEIEIAVSFEKEFALDLPFVAARNNLTESEIIEIFTSKVYRVYMLGFLPGFAYMGEIDQRIAVPRRGSPRLVVPKGSVGIAGRQTGIYPFDSPGGWQIIGKTNFPLFSPESKIPCSLQVGDLVKFISIAR